MLLQLRQIGLQVVQPRGDGLAGVQHLAPGLGEKDLFPQLFGEPHPQDGLDSPHLHRDGGLREVQFLGRAGKRKMAGHRIKHPELAQRQSAHEYV